MSERDPYWDKPAPPEYDDLFPARGYEPIQPERRGPREILRRLFAPVIAAGVFLLKFGGILLKLKFFTVAGSMIVSVGAYALLGGWWFGLGLVLLIFVHEMGHVIELRHQGVPASAPLFIPFFGAVVGMKKLPENAWKEARVALAGPLLGTVGALVVWALGAHYDSRFLVAMAFVGFLINLFNLLPVVPLDGGRAVAALHPALWGFGLAALIALEIFRPNPILPIIIILGALELWRRWKGRHDPQFEGYYKVPWQQRVIVFVVYVGLAAFLVFAMNATHVPRDF
jgi:Zn-dependent protease